MHVVFSKSHKRSNVLKSLEQLMGKRYINKIIVVIIIIFFYYYYVHILDYKHMRSTRLKKSFCNFVNYLFLKKNKMVDRL